MKKAKGPLVLLNLDKSGQASEGPQTPPADRAPQQARPAPTPGFEILEKPGVLWDLGRAALILAGLLVALGFTVVVLPQPAIDRLARNLEARHQREQPDAIALLYLGDDRTGSDFRVRGVVRNISPDPVEQLDATVRFYAHDNSILETTVVRLSKETIDPGGIAQFELVYPNYRNEFGSYSVEFKLRQGKIISYQDMRETR